MEVADPVFLVPTVKDHYPGALEQHSSWDMNTKVT